MPKAPQSRSLGTVEASAAPADTEVSTITLSAVPPEGGEAKTVTLRLRDRWPNSLKVNLAAYSEGEVWRIMNLLTLPEDRAAWLAWYIESGADDRKVAEAVDIVARAVTGHPLVHFAPWLVSLLDDEPGGPDDSDATTGSD